MTEITKTNEEQKEEPITRRSLHILEVITVLFFLLNLASSLVIMLLPLKALRGAFPQQPYKGLWMLFTLSLALMILLNALSPPRNRRRDNWKVFGTTNVIVGFLCAVEIFVLQAAGDKIPHNSLWWLLAVLTVLGAIAVVLTEKLKSRELAAAKRKEEEALAKKRKTIPTVVRLKVRRYYVSESKAVVCDN